MGFLKTIIGMALDVAQGRSWRFEDAEFTGICRDINNNIYDKIVPEGTMISEYEFTYHVFGRGNRTGWYKFPNGEMPDPAEMAGSTIGIRYDEDDPFFYDTVGEVRAKGEGPQPRPLGSSFRYKIQF